MISSGVVQTYSNPFSISWRASSLFLVAFEVQSSVIRVPFFQVWLCHTLGRLGFVLSLLSFMVDKDPQYLTWFNLEFPSYFPWNCYSAIR